MRALIFSTAQRRIEPMHSFMDAKLMAKLLRQALAERSIEITHSDSLELISRQFGVANWNVLSQD
jgi:hypothetical protein